MTADSVKPFTSAPYPKLWSMVNPAIDVAHRVAHDERMLLELNSVVVHYRQWFGLVCAHGYAVAGKEPLNTFLSQINRSDGVERVGQRTGLYRLSRAA